MFRDQNLTQADSKAITQSTTPKTSLSLCYIQITCGSASLQQNCRHRFCHFYGFAQQNSPKCAARKAHTAPHRPILPSSRVAKRSFFRSISNKVPAAPPPIFLKKLRFYRILHFAYSEALLLKDMCAVAAQKEPKEPTGCNPSHSKKRLYLFGGFQRVRGGDKTHFFCANTRFVNLWDTLKGYESKRLDSEL